MCLEKIKLYVHLGERSDWDAGQKVIEAMFNGPSDELGKLECDADKRINLESTDFTK